MARDYFKRASAGTTAASGTIISDIQLTLNAGGASIDPDGIYGGQTSTALSAFQTARGVPVNGAPKHAACLVGGQASGIRHLLDESGLARRGDLCG